MGYAFCPDEETDAKKAMASPNSMMTVSSSHDAVITPLWMDSEPNGIGVSAADDNMPFKNVDWNAMQSTVANMGVSFKAVRVSIGANQEKIPTSEILYITCGPFACSDAAAEKPQAPEISAESTNICANWDPDLTLQVGMIDNDIYSSQDSNGRSINPWVWSDDDGIDIGWVSTSNVPMTVKHVFAGDGKNYSVMGPDAEKGTRKPLKMLMSPSSQNRNYGPGIQVEEIATRSSSEGTPPKSPKLVAKLSDACVDINEYGRTKSHASQPDECFRVRVDGTLGASRPNSSLRLTNYLDGYSVEVSPKDEALTWGKVDWKEGALKDLKCQPVSFAAAEQVDVCDLLEEEVDQALSVGWKDVYVNVRKRKKSSEFTIPTSPTSEAEDSRDGGYILANWEVRLDGNPSPRHFRRLWFDDNLDGTILDSPETALYKSPAVRGSYSGGGGAVGTDDTVVLSKYSEPDGASELIYYEDGRISTSNRVHVLHLARDNKPEGFVAEARTLNDMYRFTPNVSRGYNKDGLNGNLGTLEPLHRRHIHFIWKPLVDEDQDPIHGDFGKVDLYGGGTDGNKPDGLADNYPPPMTPTDAARATTVTRARKPATPSGRRLTKSSFRT